MGRNRHTVATIERRLQAPRPRLRDVPPCPCPACEAVSLAIDRRLAAITPAELEASRLALTAAAKVCDRQHRLTREGY